LPTTFSTGGGSGGDDDDDEDEDGWGLLFVFIQNLDKKEFMATTILQETTAQQKWYVSEGALFFHGIGQIHSNQWYQGIQHW
jgi:hypothetical protein